MVAAPVKKAGAREAIRGGADVIVLDDGFQHRRLHRDLDLVVVDPRWPTEGGLLPMGEAREGSVALGRADALWLSGPGNPAALSPLLDCIQSRVVPTGWVRSGDLLALEDLPAGPVTAVAGIARPGRFLDLLVALGLDVRGWHSWPDHHAWTPGEEAALIAGAEGTTLVCTEKDRVRLSSRFPGYALRMGLEVVSGQEALEEMLDRVLA